MGSFNTYGKTSKEFGSGKNIWLQVKGIHRCGGNIDLTGYKTGDVIPAGSMCTLDVMGGSIKIVKASEIGTAEGKTSPILIKGLLYNDIYVEDGTTYATGAVVYHGEIFADRLAEAVPVEVKAVLPQIVFVNEVA